MNFDSNSLPFVQGPYLAEVFLRNGRDLRNDQVIPLELTYMNHSLVTYCDVLLLSRVAFTLAYKNISPGEVPREDHLCSCNLIFLCEAHNQWVVADNMVS